MTSPTTPTNILSACTISLTQDVLQAGNEHIQRTWRVQAGALIPLSMRVGNREWIIAAEEPGTVPPAPISGVATLQVTTARRFGVEAEGLHGLLAIGDATYEISVFPGVAAVTLRLRGVIDPQPHAALSDHGPSGIEEDHAATRKAVPVRDLCEHIRLTSAHVHVHSVQLMDRTDIHDNLAEQRSWRASPVEVVSLRGVCFAVEDPLTRAGLIFLKHAPLPHTRPVPCAVDLRVHHRDIALIGHGAGDTGEGYAWSVVGYSGGAEGRCAALQGLQRCFRPYVVGRDGLFLSNTWGDRNRDGRINEYFIASEIVAGAALGVDVVQIDDGWQRGITANSVHRDKGGVWLGFWAADPQFWNAHPERFPHGLAATAALAREHGVGLGLWFAPDSADDFSNWRKDADTVLAMHRDLGVNHVKIDGVKAHTKRAEGNLWHFFRTVLEASQGAVVFDLDVTAEIRPGYFGMMAVGPLFIENRYTDWGKYWPHATLRTIWQLAWCIDPTRLRMEFLNPSRNADTYAGDPLAPSHCSPAYICATTLLTNPLGWFETSNLPAAFSAEIIPLIAIWRHHRAALHGGVIVPLGNAPDGTQWTAFRSRSADEIHYLIYRELTDEEDWATPLPLGTETWQPEVLYGSAEIAVVHEYLAIRIADPLGFAWVRIVPPRKHAPA